MRAIKAEGGGSTSEGKSTSEDLGLQEIETTAHRAMRMTQRDLVRHLHEKLGHINLKKLKETLKSGVNTGTDITISAIDTAIARGFKCTVCDLSKITQQPEPRASGHVKTEEILGVVHTDTMVRPHNMISRRGNRYTQVFVDEATHKVWVFHMRKKEDLYGVMADFEKVAQRDAASCIQAAFRKRIQVKRYRTDGDGMLRSDRM